MFLVAAGAYGLTALPLEAAPLSGAFGASPELAALEVTVSRAPANVEALAALAESYLALSAPGLAQAALDRAPAALHHRARIADLRARSLLELGQTAPALASQERALEACATNTWESEHCSNAMLARAERRVRWLRELARLRVDDNLADPTTASLAYRLATREVRLSVP